MIKVITFDFDGVIVDSNQLKYDAFFQIFQKDDWRAAKILGEVLKEMRERPRFEILRTVFEKLGTPLQDRESLVDEYAEKFEQLVREGFTSLKAVPEVKDVLKNLGRRYAVYLNSGTHRPSLEKRIDELKINHLFRGIFGIPPAKEENLKKIMDLEKVSGFEVAVVGDGESDYAASRKHSCHFIGVPNRFNGWQEGKFPLLSGFGQLVAVLADIDSCQLAKVL